MAHAASEMDIKQEVGLCDSPTTINWGIHTHTHTDTHAHSIFIQTQMLNTGKNSYSTYTFLNRSF